MKRFTQKFFLLTVGMILSVGASAQEAVTKHAYPEVQFSIGSTTYTVPAWDAWEGYTAEDGRYMVPGHLRVQKKIKNADGTYVGKYVTRYAIYGNNQLYVLSTSTLNTQVTNVKINGNVVLEGPKKLIDLTYDIVPEADRLPGYGYTAKVYEFHPVSTKISNEVDFVVPTSFTHATTEDVYTIDEIGDYVFRQQDNSSGSYNWFEPNSITIPKEITKIGRGAFFMVPTTKVVFEEGNTIETIKEFNFQNCPLLKEITFPSSVTTLTGTVLGGDDALRKITFASENPPRFIDFQWNNNQYKVFETTYGNGRTHPDKCVISVPFKTTSINAYAAVNEFSNSLLASKVPFPASMMSTCCVPQSFTVKQFDIDNQEWVDADLNAYQVEQKNVFADKVVLTPIDNQKIPAEVGVVLKGTAGTDYEIYYLDNNNSLSYNNFKLSLDEFNNDQNILEGVITATEITPNLEQYSYFVLNGGQFHRVKTKGTLGANKAYILYDGVLEMPVGAQSLTVFFPEESGITTHEVQNAQNDVWYTLQGVQVNQPSKGVFIKNGKKFVIK